MGPTLERPPRRSSSVDRIGGYPWGMDTQGARLPSRRTALRAFIGSIAVSTMLGIWALLAGGFGELQVKVLLSSLSVSAGSLCAMGGAAAIEARSERGLGVPAIALSGLSLALVLIGIWAEADAEAYWKFTATACFFAAAFAHTSLLGLARFKPVHRWLSTAMLWLVLGLAGYGAVLLWSEASEEAAYRFLGVLSILVAAGTLATPVVHRLDAAPAPTGATNNVAPLPLGTSTREVSMLCPTCSVNFQHSLGPVQCPQCGAQFQLQMTNGA